MIEPTEPSHSLSYNITKLGNFIGNRNTIDPIISNFNYVLVPNSRYTLQLSASTVKGEGPKSGPLFVATEFTREFLANRSKKLSLGIN